MSTPPNEALQPSKKKAAPKTVAEDGAIVCPYCGDTVQSLVSIEAGMRIGLQENAKLTSIPSAVCPGCHAILAKMISMGAQLRSQAQLKEQNRLNLWRNRVTLIRKAKDHLAKREFPEAAIFFEKYLRALELVFDKKTGGLTPDLFSAEARRQEMTVVASVYWDLLRIYDQSPKYKDRQEASATKLAEFARFTPIYGHIIRKAETLARTAKNPDVFKHFLKMSGKSRARCFIASAAFEGAPDPAVETLRLFRDRVLRRNYFGRRFTLLYYRLSPPVASWIDRAPHFVRVSLRFLLRKVANRASKALKGDFRQPKTTDPS